MNLRIAALSLGLLISSPCLRAQTPVAVSAPSQFGTASTVFLASGGAFSGSSAHSPVVPMMYSSFSQSLSAMGKFRVVAAPADAQLSMVLSAQTFVSDAMNGTSFAAPYLRLEIFDTRTHTLLWTLDEPIKGAFREKALQKNVDDSVAALISDLKTLANGTIPGDPTATSTKAASDAEKK